MPFVVISAINCCLTLIICTAEPIRSEYSAAMLTGTAKAALRTLRKDHPAVALDSQGLARCVYVRQDGAAEDIVLSCLSIHSFSVLVGLIKLLPFDVVLLFVADDCLVEGDVIGVVEGGGLLG